MPRISLYSTKDRVDARDRWIGTDSSGVVTKNFSPQSIAEFIKESDFFSVAGQLTFRWQTDAGTLNAGSISFNPLGAGNQSLADADDLLISIQTTGASDVSIYLPTLEGYNVILVSSTDINTYLVGEVTAVTAAETPGFFRVLLNIDSSNGSPSQDDIFTLGAYPNKIGVDGPGGTAQYLSSAAFNTLNGELLLTVLNAPNITVGLDGRYLTSELNDLTDNVTWANVPDEFITETSVTQHQAALQILAAQILDLPDFLEDGDNISRLTNDAGYITSIPGTYLESGDNISELVNNVGYITSAEIVETDTLDSVALRNAVTAQILDIGGLIIRGDLTVLGTTTTINTEEIKLADNIIELNSNATGAPTQNAGLVINRGDEQARNIRWNESTKAWQIQKDDGFYYNIQIEGGASPLYKQNIAASFNVNHGFNTRDIAVQMIDSVTYERYSADWSVADLNLLNVSFYEAPTNPITVLITKLS